MHSRHHRARQSTTLIKRLLITRQMPAHFAAPLKWRRNESPRSLKRVNIGHAMEISSLPPRRRHSIADSAAGPHGVKNWRGHRECHSAAIPPRNNGATVLKHLSRSASADIMSRSQSRYFAASLSARLAAQPCRHSGDWRYHNRVFHCHGAHFLSVSPAE